MQLQSAQAQGDTGTDQRLYAMLLVRDTVLTAPVVKRPAKRSP